MWLGGTGSEKAIPSNVFPSAAFLPPSPIARRRLADRATELRIKSSREEAQKAHKRNSRLDCCLIVFCQREWNQVQCGAQRSARPTFSGVSPALEMAKGFWAEKRWQEGRF
jgi:hypothetical protein